jgi:rubrerythrin
VVKPAFMTEEEWVKAKLANIISEALSQAIGNSFREIILNNLDNMIKGAVKEKSEELKNKDNDLGFNISEYNEDAWISAYQEVITNINLQLEIENIHDIALDEQKLKTGSLLNSSNKPSVELRTPFGSLIVKW